MDDLTTVSTDISLLSVVTTAYNSEKVIDEFIARASTVAGTVNQKFEIVIIDDGSSDNTYERLQAHLSQGVPLKIVTLSRNFGHHKALLTGLEHAAGDLIFLVDSDLEEKPELLPEFWSIMQRESVDVVFGVQSRRERGSKRDKVVGSLFYSIYNALSETKIPSNLCVVRLMSRRYLDALLEFRETEMIIGSLWAMTGFKQISHPVEIAYKGHSTYSVPKKFGMALNAIISTSVLPLKIYFWISCIVTLLSLLVVMTLLFQFFFLGISSPGYYSIVSSIWLTSGFIASGLGLIGLYIAVIMKEAKQRPRTTIQSIDVSAAHNSTRNDAS